MFIISCKFDPERPIIYDCVKAIKQFHPDEKVVIVDSASDDKSYFDDIGVEVMDVNNKFYPTNAYHRAWYDYRSEDFYYCIHDSLILQNNLDHLKSEPLTTVRHFFTPPTGWGWNGDGRSLHLWAEEMCKKHMRMDLPGEFTGLLGPMWFCQNRVMRELDAIGFFGILPENKFQLCAMERISGIALTELGYNVANSLQGEMWDFFGDYDKTYVDKVHLTRW